MMRRDDTRSTTQLGPQYREQVLWPRMRRLISQADAIAKKAHRYADSVGKQMNCSDATKKLLPDLGVGLVCPSKPGSGTTWWGAFWELFSAIVREQMGGLLFHSSDARRYLKEKQLALWKQPAPNADQTQVARRYCFALCLYEIGRQKLPSNSDFEERTFDRIKPSHIREGWLDPDQRVSPLALYATEARLLCGRLLAKTEADLKKEIDRRDVTSGDSTSREPRKSKDELEEELAKKQTQRHELNLKTEERRQLVRELEACVSQSHDEAKPVRISLLLRILGGRYLNKAHRDVGLACDDLDSTIWGDRRALENGLRFVLNCQGENGTWPIGSFTERDPLLHAFSPLLHVLDLDTHILMHHIEDFLLPAAEKAINSIAPKLDTVAHNLDEGRFREAGQQAHFKGLLCALIEGVSVGTMVADRFRDLLSDSILQEFDASVVDQGINTDSIADSLRLKENIGKGVIDQWKTNSKRRPGAVLFYGPPGTGKTTVARFLAEQLNKENQLSSGRNWKFVEFTPADFAREGTDRIVAQAERIFKLLMDVRRCVVLLDEMEEFIRSRGQDADKTSRLITTAFLPLLQKVAESRELVLVVATNFVGTVDAAITRPGRFDLILPLGPPDVDSRRDHFTKYLERLREGKATLPSVEAQERLMKGRVEDRALWKDAFIKCVAEYTMGYAIAEINAVFEEIVTRVYETDALTSFAKFANLVWEVRARKTPLALSGLAGSNWRVFVDEASRFARTAPGCEIGLGDLADYSKEPDLPKPRDRMS